MLTKFFALFAVTLLMITSVAKASDEESFVGIGIVIQEEDKSIQIIDVYENGPAARANIVPGEWLTAVDGKSTKGQKLKTVATWLRGDLGTSVNLTVKAEKEDTSRDLQLTRELITVKCFMKGNINLNFYNNGNDSGTLSGQVGSQNVYWNVSVGNVTGYYKGQFVRLDLKTDVSNNIQITGWIAGNYISWRGFNNNIFAYQSCIR